MNTSLHFSPGERSKVVTLSIVNDLLLEKEEVLYVSISVVDHVDDITVARKNATVTIVDTDGKLRFSMLSVCLFFVRGHNIEMFSNCPM